MLGAHPQKASVNPGWKGLGIPSLRDLVRVRGGTAWHALTRGQFARSYHVALATAADIWNFHVMPSAPRVECPCCGWTGPAFAATASWRTVTPQSRCPECDSRSRHRGLMRLLPVVAARAPSGTALVFAPERVLLDRLLASMPRSAICTTDLSSTDVDAPHEDIQRLSFPSATYAMIVCNHVLEHVPDDRRAIAECARVLKAGGQCVFTIPGDFDQRRTMVIDPPDSNGHHRFYGAEIVDVLREHFSQVDVVDLSVGCDPRWHVRSGDRAFVCVK